jgi:heat shock protein HslJ
MILGACMKTALPALALLLAGCATAAAPGPAQVYRAHGTEPFWGVTIGGGRIVYSAPDQPGVDVAAPRRRPIANGYRYVTPAMRIEITHVRCNDGMGDRYYADTFLVYFPGGDRPLEGCGGATLPPDTLNDTGWGIAAIDGEAIAPAEAYGLQFADGRLSGQAGCNRFSGAYAETPATLTPGPLMSTRMACPEPRMTHERKMLRLLGGGAVRLSYPDGDTMLLTGNGVTARLTRH